MKYYLLILLVLCLFIVYKSKVENFISRDELSTCRNDSDPISLVDFVDMSDEELEDVIKIGNHCFDKKELRQWVEGGNRTNPLTREILSDEDINKIREELKLLINCELFIETLNQYSRYFPNISSINYRILQESKYIYVNCNIISQYINLLLSLPHVISTSSFRDVDDKVNRIKSLLPLELQSFSDVIISITNDELF
jgi:hypothetical protein